jgi:valyl-tRNA synthetase
MSKSLGTGIDPLGLIEKYGADATRFGMIYQNLGNQDIRFNEDAMLTGKKFCNKIWNAARFVLQNVNSQPPLNLPLIKGEKKRGSDKKILLGLEKIKKEVEKNIEKYEFGKALHKLYDFFWHDFCDIYIEESKQQLKDEKLRKNAEQILLYVLTNSLKLIHPFLPFITEEIWSQFSKNLLLIEPWPK